MVQWAGHILDRLVAPECSAVTACLAPEFPELPNYFGSFFLNNAFRAEHADKARPFILVFLRRLTQAVREYRSARDFLSQCVAAQAHSNNAAGSYLRAVAHFEQAVLNTYLAMLAHDRIGEMYDPVHELAFKPDDGTPPQRLGELYNAFKHFDARLKKGEIPDFPAPVWIVNEGLRCANPRQHAATVTLSFAELVEIMKSLEDGARFLSEDVYRLAAERRRQRAERSEG